MQKRHLRRHQRRCGSDVSEASRSDGGDERVTKAWWEGGIKERLSKVGNVQKRSRNIEIEIRKSAIHFRLHGERNTMLFCQTVETVGPLQTLPCACPILKRPRRFCSSHGQTT
ncbi:hypothetical protein PHSY_007242 [Pseudozyma hubeiensis SY62]|uniref:Uncharacterized protein n=1 Tax=Pseudozyma hubeiensis (strain SY62) TaxID=1305764 RepID=R9PE42_PSEHS|nr:hypothetical protein PHSY_007242 [Pseudozyma hubeiensis SY62]GAC99639.1 hypothetical protein PHSY_007242 [Pseudozyma hubeiensis SY62]